MVEKSNEKHWDPEVVVDEIIHHFNQNTTVRTIATFLIVNKPYCNELTHDQMADVVQRIKHRFGLLSKTTGSSIAWYKQDMKKRGNHEELRSSFTAHFQTLPEKEKEKIMLDLAERNINELIRSADVQDLEKYIPIKDDPTKKPTETQVAAARQSKGKEKETNQKQLNDTKVAPLSLNKGGKSTIAK